MVVRNSLDGLEQLTEPLGAIMRYGFLKLGNEDRKVWVSSGLRTREQQIALRRKNCGTSQHSIFEASSGSCSPPTAKPGQSNHETGNAVDVGANEATKHSDRDRLFAVTSKFGIARPVPGEDWHFEYRGSDPQGDLDRVTEAASDEFDSTPGFFGRLRDNLLGTFAGPVAGGLVDDPISFSNIVRGSKAVGGFVLDEAIDQVAPEPVQEALEFIGAAVGWLTVPANWVRIGTGAAGLGLIYGGGLLLVKELGTGAVGEIGKVLQ